MSNPSIDPWQKLGLPRVINAAGKMTYLGSSAVVDDVAEAIIFGAQSYVDMAELKTAAGKRIVELVDVPAACVVSSAAAGIVQAIAAIITGTDRTLIEQVPCVNILKRDVIIQKSHAVNFGAPITQMIRLGGGNPVEIGSSNRCYGHQLESVLSETTASVLFVVSHHVQAEEAISLLDTISIAHSRGVKVIVDAAAETDLTKYVELGADLVIYSGHKAIGGPTSGIVMGDPTLIEACVAQETGAGRAMKVSKEAISGLLSALELYISGEGIASEEELVARLERVQSAAGGKLPAHFDIVWDKTRPIPRLVVTILKSSPKTAREIVSQLEGANPSIRTRNHAVDEGLIGIDPRELTMDGAKYLGLLLREALTGENFGEELEGIGKS